MNTNKLSGRQRHLRFAFPCADGRCQRGEITPDDLKALEGLVKEGGEPDPDFLAHCFPLSVGPLGLYAKKKGVADMYDYDTVGEFWVTAHGRGEDQEINQCPVEEAVVINPSVKEPYGGITTASLAFTAFGKGKHATFFSPNIYHLPLKEGYIVRLHKRVIIEIKENEV